MIKIILDANVLLTGIFVPQSKSRQVLSDIEKGHIAGYIVENTIEEAEGVAERVRRNTGVRVSEVLYDAIVASKVIILPRIVRVEAEAFSQIKGRGDKAIVAAASKLGAIVCTNDIGDFKESPRYGVSVTTPYDLVHDGVVALDMVFPGFISNQKEGTYYIESPSLLWADIKFRSTPNYRMYFFDLNGFGSLFFEASSHSFVFQMDNGLALSIKSGVVTTRDLPIKIVLTYEASSGIDMFIGHRGKKNSLQTKWIPGTMSGNERIFLGSDRFGKNQLAGCILLLFSLPNYMTERAANNLMAGITVKQPWERLGLEKSVEMMFGGQ